MDDGSSTTLETQPNMSWSRDNGARSPVSNGGDSERIDADDRMEEDEREDLDGRSEPLASGSWFLRSLWATSSSSEDSSMIGRDDSREEDVTVEREGEGHSPSFSRIHEPLKRYQNQPWQDGTGYSRNDHDIDGGGRNKRRRMGESLSIRYFHTFPAMTERQQTIMEYSAPSCLAPFFHLLGFSPFALRLVKVMFVMHFIQTALSTFGTDPTLRLKPWITPLVHHLMDSYLWNQSLITAMVLYPHLFGDNAYWWGVLVVWSQHLYLVTSLKTHYINNQEGIQKKAHRHIEHSLSGIFRWYLLDTVLFILAKVLSNKYVLWAGVVHLNLGPMYLVWAYKKRMDAATIVNIDKECRTESKKES